MFCCFSNWTMFLIMLFILVLVCFMFYLHKVQVTFRFKIWESVGLSHNVEENDGKHWG